MPLPCHPNGDVGHYSVANEADFISYLCLHTPPENRTALLLNSDLFPPMCPEHRKCHIFKREDYEGLLGEDCVAVAVEFVKHKFNEIRKSIKEFSVFIHNYDATLIVTDGDEEEGANSTVIESSKEEQIAYQKALFQQKTLFEDLTDKCEVSLHFSI